MNTQSNDPQELRSQILELKKLNASMHTAVKKLHNELIQTRRLAKRAVENTNRNKKDINNIVQKLSR